jgi:hypothetical protein
MRTDTSYEDTLIAIAKAARAINAPIDLAEEQRQIRATLQVHRAWDAQGLSMGITLAPTVFGDTPRQTLILETDAGTTYCVCDGGLTAGIHAVYFDEYLRLRGIIA